jgi:LAS superfamily LD-carboxypeptidase LdcB
MRVIEPRSRQSRKKSHNHHEGDSLLAAIGLLILLGVIWFVAYRAFTANDAPPATNATTSSNSVQAPQKTGIIKTYTGDQFRELYERFAYPNTQRIDEHTPITGFSVSDERIKSLAATRGYTIRTAPVTDTFRSVAPGMQLQERAVQPWLSMQASAKQSGQLLELTAAYRSAEDQKQLFLNRLQAQGVVSSLVGNGTYDAQVLRVLASTAPPGYSRHHSGYTIDIACKNDPLVSFDRSSCYQWLSVENYKNAKTFGWIPSYPVGATRQGPEPESWEYVWVGSDTLTE